MTILIYIVSVLILILSLIFIFRSKILKAVGILPNFFFVLFLSLSLSALFFPPLFDYLAKKSIEKAGIVELINEMDQKIEILNVFGSIEEKKDSAFLGIKNLFSFGADETTQNKDRDSLNFQTQNPKQDEAGFFMKNLYPKIFGLIRVIYRFFALLVGIAGLIVTIYFAYSVQSIRETAKLEKRISILEDMVAKNQINR
ncbi:MAG: hypothetical protein GF335_01535 [Candidatus Moranbacteria bacterium]|nr:hypothetical protein [Candidatus Moranbacteria bacterium]